MGAGKLALQYKELEGRQLVALEGLTGLSQGLESAGRSNGYNVGQQATGSKTGEE